MELLQSVAPLDWLFLGIVMMSLLIGAWRGLVYEVLAVMGWVAAFIAAPLLASSVGQILPLGNLSEPLRYAAGFACVFVITVMVAGLLSWMASRGIDNIGLRPVDRVLGALFGTLRGLLLLLAVVVVVQLTPVGSGSWWQKSWGYRALDALLQTLKPVLPPDLGKYIKSAAPATTPTSAATSAPASTSVTPAVKKP